MSQQILVEIIRNVKDGNYKTLPKRCLKNWVAIAMMSVPDPFNEYHKMKHNSAITRQNQLKFWDQNAKQGFS